jgi:hypothetical protein
MRTLTAVCLVAVLVLGGLAAPAEAGHGGHRGNNFGVGFIAGAATAVFLHSISRPYVYYPAVPSYGVYYYPPVYHAVPPVYYAPAPACRSVWVEGGWQEVPRDQGGGFTSYYGQWVPGHWERVCR